RITLTSTATPRGRIWFSSAPGRNGRPGAQSTPVDCAEPVVTEQRVEDADGAPGLRPVAERRRAVIAARDQILDGYRMLLMHAHGQGYVCPHDIVVPISG